MRVVARGHATSRSSLLCGRSARVDDALASARQAAQLVRGADLTQVVDADLECWHMTQRTLIVTRALLVMCCLSVVSLPPAFLFTPLKWAPPWSVALAVYVLLLLCVVIGVGNALGLAYSLCTWQCRLWRRQAVHHRQTAAGVATPTFLCSTPRHLLATWGLLAGLLEFGLRPDGWSAYQSALDLVDQLSHAVSPFLDNASPWLQAGPESRTLHVQHWFRLALVFWHLACGTVWVGRFMSCREHTLEREGLRTDTGERYGWVRQLMIDVVCCCTVAYISWTVGTELLWAAEHVPRFAEELQAPPPASLFTALGPVNGRQTQGNDSGIVWGPDWETV